MKICHIKTSSSDQTRAGTHRILGLPRTAASVILISSPEASSPAKAIASIVLPPVIQSLSTLLPSVPIHHRSLGLLA